MRVLAALLLLAAADPVTSVDGLPLAPLPRQELPAQGCAAFLWTMGPTKALVAMAGAADGRLRLSIGGTVTDLARSGSAPAAGLGLAGPETFVNGTTSAVLDLTVETRSDIDKGAVVPAGTLRLDRAGQDSVVVPVRGLIGCAA